MIHSSSHSSLRRATCILAITTIFLSIFTGCGNSQYQETKGKIIERKDIGNGQIQLNYIFKVGQTTIASKKNIENVAINTDSVDVKYNIKNPLDNKLLLQTEK